jgi:hypothetical protein
MISLSFLAMSATGYVVHNASDCCCANLYPRSVLNVAASRDECAQQCQSNAGRSADNVARDGPCRAAVLITGSRAAGQCKVPASDVPAGHGCCLQKGFMATDLHRASPSSTIIDLGTTPAPAPLCPDSPTPMPASGPGYSGEALRPWYHFTRREGEMNDPNGLQWRRRSSGAVSYEMFHQHNNGSSACYGSEGSGHVWAHASSPGLVRWVRRPEASHMACASTGAGITLPPGFQGPNNESWLSANLGSAPAMHSYPDETVGRGLKLWVSNDSAALNEYYEYLPPGTKTIDPKTRQNDACVICPRGVREGPPNPPNWTRAADIGDSYIWSEPEWNVPSAHRTFYALSGQGRCPEGGPPMWCGWAKGREPQALLWSSSNLVDWKFVSEF